jgi:hypothetical protein
MPTENHNGRKEYHSPRLKHLGDFRRLTQVTKGGGANDGGGAKPNTKSGGGSGT